MASHLASVFDGSLLPSTRPPPPSSPSSLSLPLGLHGSPPSGTSPSGSSGPPGSSNSLFTPLTIHMYIGQLPTRKAPGADHIKAEMLKPISTDLSHLLSWFFSLCCQWSYVPSLWRHAQVYPIFKKESSLSLVLLHGCLLSLLLLTSLKVVSVLVDLLWIKLCAYMS
ncbi:hypothetical protein G6F29_013887 [Rhizopus arrhizus]|nr:hypothetical protein G6F29_013887 [Rhizopus arrhizus]